MPRLQAIAASIRKRFYDNFASRTNTTGSLGTATDGSAWDAVNGTIQVSTGAAVPTTTPSAGGAGNTYPMATVNMPTSNNIIKIGGANDGSAAAVWVQSGTDWWMVDVEADQTINANYSYAWATYYATATSAWYSQYAGTAAYTQATASGIAYNTTSYGMNVYTSSTYQSGKFVTTKYTSSRYANTNWGSVTNYYAFPGDYYSAIAYTTSVYTMVNTVSYSNSYTFISGYTTIKNEYLKIRQSVANVVSVVTSQLISTSQSIASFLVSLSGNVITAKAYSDTNFVTQIGSDLVYTATGATITTKYGISLAPSTNYQSTTIGTSVDITRG